MARLKWFFRQVLPLTYRSRYRNDKGQAHFVVWRMWFGKVFTTDDVLIQEGCPTI
jgi:hypothetical protein